MQKEIPKTFESNQREKEIYSLWKNSGFSNPDTMQKYLEEKKMGVKTSFTITLPPPNANGTPILDTCVGTLFMMPLVGTRE